MSQTLFVPRRRLALAVWATGMLLFLLLGLWNVRADRQEAESRLSGEAGRMAAQLAVLLALPAWELDELTARTIVMAAMEDEAIYAVKVEAAQGMLEGQRRNWQWEPVPWDDEIAENSVRGVSPLKMEGRPVGSVEVYLSSRATDEDLAQKARREVWRFCLAFVFCTVVLLLLLWHGGHMARLRALLTRRAGLRPEAAHGPESRSAVTAETFVLSGAEPRPESGAEDPRSPARVVPAAGSVVSADLARAFLLRRPEAWRVTAGLFCQTFGHAPGLLLRLYGAEDVAGLSHLGHILERAAPLVGAERLSAAADTMQTALHDAGGARAALAVEACARELEAVLVALGRGLENI